MNKSSYYLSLFCDSRYDNMKVLRNLLKENDYDDLCKIAAKMPSTFSGLISLSFLRRKSYNMLHGKGFLLAKPYEKYTGMLAFIFKQNKSFLNDYIKSREEYEMSLLLGDYTSARTRLNEIKNISCSIWTLEQDIKLERLQKGLSACTKLYDKLYTESGNIYSYMAYIAYISSSIEYSFESDVELNYKGLKEKTEKDICGYVVSHSMPYFTYEYADWVQWDLKTSLFDLYENFILSLNVLDSQIINNEEFKRNILRIYDSVKDKRLMMFLAKNHIKDYFLSEKDKKRETILENYYKGNYKNVIDDYSAYGKDSPWDTALLDIYVKSLLLTKSVCPVKGIDHSTSIVNRIIFYYYNYLCKTDNSQSLYYRNLKTLCYSCYSIYGISHLLDIINGYEKKNVAHMLDDFSKNSYGRTLRAKFTTSNLCLNTKVRSYNEDKELMELQLNPDMLEQEDVFNKLLILLDVGMVASFLKDQVCSYLFSCLISKHRLKEAVCFFVNNKINSSLLDISFDRKKLKENFEDDFDLRNEIPLELSVFYTMIGLDDYKRYMPYKKVLSRCGVKRPSELKFSDNKLLAYFLANVVDTKVLSFHVRRFDTLDDVFEERLKICGLLYDKTSDSIFKDEIAHIYRERSIRKLTKKIDESKINVDVGKIISEGLDEEKVLFELFQSSDETMKYYSSLDSLIKLMNKNGFDIDVLITVDDSQKINYKKSLCEKLFLLLRDRFLCDPKYGLDFFLSTRIRHGTLINQLRNHFQAHNLVTNIIEKNHYKDDAFWSRNMQIKDERDLYYLRKQLKNFSECLDATILHLKDQVIQIKTELINTEKKSTFDFSLSQIRPYIERVFEKSSELDFSEFIRLVFDTLWNITERRLEETKIEIDKIQIDIRQMLDNVEKDITSEFVGKYNLSEFQSAIRSCKTEFQHDMDIVKSWFSINNKSDFSFEIKNVVDACLSVHNRINNYPLNIDLDNLSSTKFKGQYFDMFNDLFHDLFNNVTSYCRSAQEALTCKVSIKERGNFLELKVSNKLLDKDISSIQSTITHIEKQEQAMLLEGMGKKEKSSGIVKISNIVSNLLPGNNSYKNSIENSMFVAEINIQISSIRA